jgi:hypothetical protein
MENSSDVDIENANAIKFRLCPSHREAMEDWIGNPRTVTFTSFDADYVDVERDKFPSRDKWTQKDLRYARRLTHGDREHLFDDEGRFERNQDLESTLLVAAVDVYNIEYSETESAIPRLVQDLQQRGLAATERKEGEIDIEIRFPDADEPVLGTVFTLPSDADRYKQEPLGKYERTPERAATDTIYYRLSQGDQFSQTAYENYSCSHYVAFYKLPGETDWIWYPISEDYTNEFGADHRTFLTIAAPTGDSPMLGLDHLQPEFLDERAYEARVSENWDAINEQRTAVEKARDYVWKLLES